MKADSSQRKIGKHELLLLYPKKKLIAYTLSSSTPPWINLSSFCPKVVVMISLVVQFICIPCNWVSWVGEAGYNSKRVSLSGIRMLVGIQIYWYSLIVQRASVGWWCWGGIGDVEPDHRRWMRARGWFHSTGEISQYNDKIRQLQDFLSRKVIEHARTRNCSTPHRMCASKLQKQCRYQRRDGQANRCTLLLKWGISPLEKSHVWGGLVTSLSAFYSLIFDDHPSQNTLTMYCTSSYRSSK